MPPLPFQCSLKCKKD